MADLVLISEAEANQRVAAEATAEANRDAALKARLQAVPAEAEWESDDGGRKVVFRRVSPKAVDASEPLAATESSPVRSFSQAEMDAWIAVAPEFVMFSASATVYDGDSSKLEIRYEDAVYTAWTNVDFRYLREIGGFETEERSYSYFNFTHIVDREKEAETVRRAAEKGYDYESRWKAAPVAFSGAAPEYVLVTADAAAVPEEVYRRLDDLFAHYLEHKARLKIQYRNRNLLNAARKEDREDHPPEPPQDIIINFYPLSERKTAR